MADITDPQYQVVREHVEQLEGYARRIVDEHEDNARARHELQVAIDHLDAVRTDLAP